MLAGPGRAEVPMGLMPPSLNDPHYRRGGRRTVACEQQGRVYIGQPRMAYLVSERRGNAPLMAVRKHARLCRTHTSVDSEYQNTAARAWRLVAGAAVLPAREI